MRILYSLLLIFFLPVAVLAQGITISTMEYFFNTDPGFGQGNEIEIITPATTHSLLQQLNTNALSNGFHNLYVRAQSEAGHWGPYETKVIYVGTEAGVNDVVEIVTLEYFFNTDPGLGNGTSINVSSGTSVSLVQSLNTSGLATGFHNLYLRGKTAAGHWGPYETKVIYINTAAVTDGIVEVKALEYFFNTDPGFGQGTVITTDQAVSVSLSQSIVTANLSPGFHNLYVRGQLVAGSWGPYETKVIYISSETNNVVEIAALEYFIGTDPGFGQGTVIGTDQAVSVSLSQTITTQNLSPGFHNLYLRGKSTAGVWGPYETKVLYVDANANEPLLIDQVEFFVDTDPGVGQGQIVSLEAAQSVNEVVEVITSSLTVGAHKVYMRARSTDNAWGPYVIADITIYPEILSETFETGLPVTQGSASYALNSGTWAGQNIIRESTLKYQGDYAAKLLAASSSITSPIFSGVSTVSFYYALPSAGTNNFIVQKSVNGGTFTTINTVNATNTTFQLYTTTLNHEGATVQLKIINQASTNPGLIIDNFLATSLNPVEVAALYPGNNGTNVAIDSTFAIVFNQDVIKGTGNIYIIDKSDSTVVETIALSAVTVVNDSAYFTPTLLDYEKQYAVTISAGAFKEPTETLTFSGILNNSTWAFTTADTPELPVLQFTGVVPANGFAFANVDAGSKDAAIQMYQVTGLNLDAGINLQVAPMVNGTNPGFDISLSGSVYVTNATIPIAEATNKTVHVRAIVPANNGRSYSGKITHTSTNAQTVEIPISVTELNQPATVSISTPANLATFAPGAEINITWNITNMMNEPLTLEYSTNQADWILINQTTVYSGSSGFLFDTEGLSTGTYFLRIKAASLPEPVTSAVRQITIANPPVITITSPNGGESWQVGSTQTIAWTAENISGGDNIEIKLSTNGGSTYDHFIQDGNFTMYQVEGGYAYQWLVPNNITANAKVRVENQTKGVSDASNAVFEIVPANQSNQLIETFDTGMPQSFTAANVSVQLPTGNWTFTNVRGFNDMANIGRGAGANFFVTPEFADGISTIAFDALSTDPDGVFIVSYSTNSGVDYITAGTKDRNIVNAMTNFSYEINTNVPTRIKLEWISGIAPLQVDDFTFNLQQPSSNPPSISLTSPNGGDTWQVGTNQTITWTAENIDLSDNIEIRLSTDGGLTYPTLIESGVLDEYVDGDGFAYEWLVSNDVSANAKIKILNTTKNVFDVSDVVFEIEAAPVATFLAGFASGIPATWSVNNAFFEDNPDLGFGGVTGSVRIQGGANGNFLQSPYLNGVTFFNFYYKAVSQISNGARFEVRISTDGVNFTTIAVISPFQGQGDMALDGDGFDLFTHTFDPPFDGFIQIFSLDEGDDFVVDNFAADGDEDDTPPVISNASVELIEPNMYGTATINELGTLYYVVYSPAAPLNDPSEIKQIALGSFGEGFFLPFAYGAVTIESTDSPIEFVGESNEDPFLITAGGELNVYYVAEDAAGNLSEITSFIEVLVTAPPSITFPEDLSPEVYLNSNYEVRFTPVSIELGVDLVFELSTNNGATYPFTILTENLGDLGSVEGEYFFNFLANNELYVSQSARIRVKYQGEVFATTEAFAIKSPNLSNLSVVFPSSNKLYFDKETTISFTNNGLSSINLYRVVPGVGQILIQENINVSGQPFSYAYTPDFVGNNIKFRITTNAGQTYETGLFTVANTAVPNVGNVNFGVVTHPSTPSLSYSLARYIDPVTVTSTNPDFFLLSIDNFNFFDELNLSAIGGAQNQTIYVRFAPGTNNGLTQNGTIQHTVIDSNEDPITINVNVSGKAASSNPSMVLFTPANGAEVVSNSILNISWESTSVSSLAVDFTLDEEPDEESNWNLIESGLNGVAQFEWLVPEVSSVTNAAIRLRDAANIAPVEMVEFLILPAPTITSLSLNGSKTVLTINGTGFSSIANDNQVVFPGFPDIIVYPSSATTEVLIVEVPSAAVSGFIQVNVANKGTAISSTQIVLDGIQISPDRGQVGQTIFINGSGVNFTTAVNREVIFTNGDLGGVVATSVSVVDAEILSVTVPVGVTNEGPITVSLDGTVYTSANTFKVQSFDFTPKTAGIFEQFTITGVNTNFLNNGTQVLVNGVQATSVSVQSNTQILVTVPQGASTGKVTISTNDGFYESSENMNVELHTITSLSATRSGRGTIVTISGSRFINIPNGNIRVNGVQVFNDSFFPFTQRFSVVNANTITVHIPNTASGTGKITVTQGGVEVESTQDFTVIPYISSLSSSQGAPGAQITIFGSYFSATNNTVYFGGNKPAAIVSQNTSQIVVVVPDGAVDGNIRVVNNDVDEEGVSATSFDVVPVHTFASFAPLKATVGQTVTLTGTNLNSPNPSQILVNGINVSVTPVNSTTVTFTVPNIHGAGKIQVTRAGVTLTSAENFTVLPKIDSWTLATGAVVGATVDISGSGFNPTHTNNEVRFANNVLATTTTGNSNFVRVTVPNGAVTGKFTVTNKIINESAESATDFLVVPAAIISSFTPANGKVGITEVTITGQNFNTPNPTNVLFNGLTASNIQYISATEIRATVPSNAFSSGPITINRAGGTTSSETFFLAPDITSLSATTLASGATLTINGTFLNNVNQVLVGDVNATITFNNSFNFVNITVPTMTPGTYKVKVIKNGLEDESDADLIVVPAHTITSFPQVVNKGENIVIMGTNLNNPVPTSITLNGFTASVVSNTGTELTITVPGTMTNGGQGKVSIVRAGLTVQSATDIYIRHTIASATSIYHASNFVVGQSATISGSNFFSPNVSQVLVNGVNATFNFSSDNALTFTVPNAVGTGKVTVVKPTPVGSVESSFDITVVPRAVLSSFSPTIQNVVQQIVITGQNFTAPDVTSISINNTNINVNAFTINSATQITATVPSISNSFIQGNVVISRAGLNETLGTFIVRHAVSSVTPTTVAAGAAVSIFGSYLNNPNVSLTLGGVAITPSFNNVNTVTFTIPSNTTPGSKEIILTRSGSDVSAGNITVLAPHTISSFSTDRVARGGELVITGTNFDNSPQVFVNGSLAANFTVNNATQITLTMPNTVVGNTATIMIRRGGLDVSVFDGTTPPYEGSAFVYMIPTVTTDITTTNYVLGQSLTLSGGNFLGITSVQVDGKTINHTVQNDNSLFLTLTGNPVALTAGTFAIKLIKSAPNPDLELTLGPQITLVNQASVINITEDSAPVGGTVTITGTNFTNPNVTSVFLNGVSAVFNVVNSETITATVPNNASAFANFNNIILNRGALNVVGSDAFFVEHGISSFLRSNFTTINTNLERVVEGETIYIEGNHFESLASITNVTVNGVVVTPSFINGNRLSVVVPNGSAGVGKVAITRRGVTVESAKALTISPKAVITELAPAAMIAGGIITVKGSGFTLPNTTNVTVNGAAATFTITNSANIKVTIPTGATATGNVSVTRNGVVSNTLPFSVIPKIFNFTNTGLPESVVTINGSHFGNTVGTNQVFFTSGTGLNLTATVQTANATTITALVPEGTVTGPIKVVNTTSGQSVTSSSNFNILLPPTNFNITPTSGPVASQFTIAGTNLNGVNEVTINGISATTFTVDPAGTNIIVTVPNAATSGNVLVKKSGLTYLAGNFSVTPRITSFPTLAVAGSQININGKTFTGAVGVTVNGNAATIVGTPTSDLITVLLNANNVGIGNIVVTTPSGTGTSASTIEVKGPPMITDFSPIEGTEGDVVTITGTDLSTVTFVKFNGVNASFTKVSDTEILATVPSNPGTGKISLGLTTYTNTSVADFSYIKSDNDPPAVLAVVAELVANLQGNKFFGNVTADKVGTVYFVATTTGFGAPTATQVRNATASGQVLSGNGALAQAFVGANVTGTGTIVSGTTYHMYFVAQDNNGNLSEVYPKLNIVAQTPVPVLTLTAPNGGQSWLVGTTQNITWTTENIPGTDVIEILLSTNNGDTYTTLADGLFSTYNGTFAWTVTETPSTQAKIKILNLTQASAKDSSDVVFSIVLNPTLALQGVVPATGLTFNNVNTTNPAPQSYQVVGTNLQSPVTVQALGQGTAQPSFRISLDGVEYGLTVTIPAAATVNTAVFVRPLTNANNGRSFTGSITHSTNNVAAITMPVVVNELSQVSTIAISRPAQDTIINTQGILNLVWQTTNMVNTEPIQVSIAAEGQPYTVLQTTTNATKEYQYSAANLADGKYALKVATTQLPTLAKDSLRFVVDLTPPVVTVNKVESRNGSPALSGTVDDPEAVVTISIAGFTPTYNASVSGTNWTVAAGSIQPPLADGTYNIQARAVDKRGNIGNDETTGELIINSIPVATAATEVAPFSFKANWRKSVAAQRYLLDVATDQQFANKLVGFADKEVTDTTLLINDAQLYHKQRYFYRIRAVYGANDVSVYSNVISVTLPESPQLAADSSALLSLYNTTGGPGWTSKTGWLSAKVTNWQGVSYSNGRITALALPANNLKGDASASTLANMTALTSLNLANNDLSGLPNLGNIQSLTTVNLSANRLDFADLQAQTNISIINFSNQKTLLEYTEVILAENQTYVIDRSIGGTGNSYAWTKNGQAHAGFSDGTITLNSVQFEDEGSYAAQVTNAQFAGTTLSTQALRIFVSSIERDSLALVALYNATNGPSWTGVTGWLTAPLAQWTGVTVANQRVTAVNLSGKGIKGVVPSDFATMASVTNIDLSNNQIDAIPDFKRMANLTNLNLSRNSLEFDAILLNLDIINFDFSNQAPITIKVEERVREGLDYVLSINVEGDDLSYQWYFNGQIIPGATTTMYTIQGINYDKMGGYRCDIANARVSAKVPGFALSTGDFEILAIADIGGTVRNLANQLLPQGYAILYRTRPIGFPFDSVARAPIVNGKYNFPGVVLGDYIVRMFGPEQQYFPTYHRAASTWTKADTVKRRKDDNQQYDAFIFFNPPKLQAGPNNRNEVIGILEIEENDFPDYFKGKTGGRQLARRRVAEVGIAFNRQRAVNRGEEEEIFELIAYVVTDENGEFEQPFLPNGTYQIVFEFPGIPMDPNSFTEFVLGGDPRVDGEKIQLAAQITPTGIVVTKIETTGIRDDYFKGLSVFPNPTSQYVHVKYERLIEAGLEWQVINLNGQQMMRGEVPSGFDQQFTLDVGHLTNGMYMINITDPNNHSNNQVTTIRFIVRK